MNDPAKKVWLHLLGCGEFKTNVEIRKGLPEVLFPNLSATLHELSSRGSLMTRKEGTKLRYGVTRSCGMPRGMKVSEVADVLAEHQRAG